MELLAHARGDAPAAGAQDAAWQALSTRIVEGGAAAGAGSTLSTSAIPGAGMGLAAKWLAAGAAVALAGVVAMGAVGSGDKEPLATPAAPATVPAVAAPAPDAEPTGVPAVAATPSALEPVEPVVEDDLELEDDEEVVDKVPTRSNRRARRAPSSKGDLLAETQLLRRANRALSAGRHKAALAAVAEYRRKFPRGTLRQELAATEVMALCGQGSASRARALHGKFKRRYPKSPHLSRIASACSDL